MVRVSIFSEDCGARARPYLNRHAQSFANEDEFSHFPVALSRLPRLPTPLDGLAGHSIGHNIKNQRWPSWSRQGETKGRTDPDEDQTEDRRRSGDGEVVMEGKEA